ncbi:cytochrome c oxidase assembly factor 3 homolog, mitochondrial-like [Glandiceps talaboti]
MADSRNKPPEVMRRVDFSRDQISPDDMEFVQQMTKRHSDLMKQKLRAKYFKRNTIVGCLIATAVVGVYAYSMFAVRQETFLDETFDSKESKS